MKKLSIGWQDWLLEVQANVYARTDGEHTLDELHISAHQLYKAWLDTRADHAKTSPGFIAENIICNVLFGGDWQKYSYKRVGT